MADERMTRVRNYLKPVQTGTPLDLEGNPKINPRTGEVMTPIAEFAEFWAACSDDEKTEYAAGVLA